MKTYFILNLRYFDDPVVINTTGSTGSGNDLSPEMKTFYDKNLIKNAKANLVHDQFGQKRNIPKGGGKSIEFRRFSKLAVSLTPLTEGVTPAADKMNVTTVTAEVKQYGRYYLLSDMLTLTAIDPILVEATENLGINAGETLDAVTREVLCGGTNVQYGDGSKTGRDALTTDDKMSVEAIRRGVRTLKRFNVQKINGYYACIIHPDIWYDLTKDPDWEKINLNTEIGVKNIYEGELGHVLGVRFVESTQAKIFYKAGNVATANGGDGSTGRDIYATLLIGKDAYGVTTIEGAGLETIIKQKGSSGTADPLNQRASAGWKGLKTAVILVQENLLRIETQSTFSDGEAA